MHPDDHKTLRLCRQVERAVSLTLAGECGDERLDGLHVRSVTPAPGPGQLMVTLSAAPEKTDLVEAYACLGQVEGFFRAELARMIHRKRVPRLSFRILPEGVEESC